jgi:hypothetical protein
VLGPCYPVAKAVLSAVAKPFHHAVRHVAHPGAGHHAPHLHVYHAAAHAAVPNAGGSAITCGAAPGGVLPAGPGLAGVPGALGGPAHAGTMGSAGGATLGGGGLGSGAAAGGFGGAAVGGLGAGAGLLASAALIAGGLAMAGSLMPAPVTPQRQAPTVQLAKARLPFIAAPILPNQVPGTVPGTAPGKDAGFAAPRGTIPRGSGPGSPVNVPEPASIALLAAGVAVLLAHRNARHA